MSMRCSLALFGLAAIGQLLGVMHADAQEFAVTDSAKAAIIAETNAYRATKGLPPLSESVEASREAQAYAEYLAETTKQGHSADGRSPFYRLRVSGAKFCKFRGENWHESWTRPERVSPEAAVAAAMTFGSIRPAMSARFARPRPRSASASPAGATAISGTTRRSRCSSTRPASGRQRRAPMKRETRPADARA
jgi:hypothetical protein